MAGDGRGLAGQRLAGLGYREIAAKYALNPEAGIVARSNWTSLWTRLQELGQFFDMSFGDCGAQRF